MQSLAEKIAHLPPEEREKVLEGMDLEALETNAEFWLRPNQLDAVSATEWLIVMLAGRGAGKALTDDELIPTPSGWTRMGDLRVGDEVFDHAGRPTEVTGVFPQGEVECAEVVFSDGAVVTASLDHLWTGFVGKNHGWYVQDVDVRDFDAGWWSWQRKSTESLKPQCVMKNRGATTVTTAELSRSVRIPNAGPMHLPDAVLPVDPWVFGAWLGDGATGSGHICAGAADAEYMKQQCAERGYIVTNERVDPRNGTVLWKLPRLHEELKALGLARRTETKRVPAVFLRGSRQQRLDLVRGLMDTDGGIATDMARAHSASAGFVNREIADALHELFMSLGYSARRRIKRLKASKTQAERNFYIVSVRARRDINPFMMPRKADLVSELPRAQASRKTMRTVREVHRVGARAATCITVAASSELFLAGRSMVPTHNTRTGAEWVREKAKTPMTRIALVARTVADVRDTLVQGESGILAVTPVNERPEYVPSLRRLTWPNGSVAMTFCLDDGAMALTQEGWKTHNELEPGDVIYTLNPKTQAGEWQAVSAVNRFSVVDEAVSLVGGDGHKYLNVRATENHRWIGQRRREKPELEFFTTAELTKKSRIPTAARCASIPTVPTYCDELAAIMGWFLAEGHVTKSKTVIIAQHRRANAAKWAEIHRLLTGLFGPESDRLDDQTRHRDPRWRATETHFHLNARASWEITDYLDDRPGKWVQPSFIHALTDLQLQLFIDAAVDGDGSRRSEESDCWTVTQAVAPLHGEHGGLVDALDLALTLLGRPHTRYQSHGEYRGAAYPCVNVTQLGSRRAATRGVTTIAETYTGIVWCPTTENGTWLAMHQDGRQAFFTGNSAEEPSQLRGPQFDCAWADELASWRLKPDDSGLNAWDNLKIATRLGLHPQIFATTTPKRIHVIRGIINMAKTQPDRVRLIRGSTMDNAANLAPEYLETIFGMYAGTSIERQELYGELLDAVEGALWDDEMIEKTRTYDLGALDLDQQITVVGVDPSVAANPNDECGIIVATSTKERLLHQRRAWVLDDRSLRASPDMWAKVVVETAKQWNAIVVAEKNQGHELVRMAIRGVDPTIPVIMVNATKGKAIRAEPVVQAYEQERVAHLGRFIELEDEQTGWVPGETGYSPNRLDAAVWALTALLVDDKILGKVGHVTAGSAIRRARIPGLAERPGGLPRPVSGGIGEAPWRKR